jgi:hypothetical protein
MLLEVGDGQLLLAEAPNNVTRVFLTYSCHKRSAAVLVPLWKQRRVDSVEVVLTRPNVRKLHRTITSAITPTQRSELPLVQHSLSNT